MPWPITEPATEPAIDEAIVPIMLGACGCIGACIGGGAVCICRLGAAAGGGAG